MDYSSAQQRLKSPWLALLAATMMLACARPAPASLLRWSPSGNAEAHKSVVLQAGTITAWTGQGNRFFHLKDNVLIEQGNVTIRFQRGILRIDEEKQKQTGSYFLEIYAEGGVKIVDGPKILSDQQAHLKMLTHSEVKLKPASGNIPQQAPGSDPFFQRAREVFAASVSLPPVPPPLPPPPPASLKAPVGSSQVDYSLPPLTAAVPAPAAPPVPEPAKLGNPVPKSVHDMAIPLPGSGLAVVKEKSPVQLVGGSPLPPTPPGPPPGVAPLPPPAVVGDPSPFLPGFLSGTGEKQYSIRPRSSFQELQYANKLLPTGETAVIVSSGVILTVLNADGKGGILDIEADQLVFWTEGSPHQILEDLKSARSQKNRSLEFYLAGHVEIRVQTPTESRVLRADEVYYDVNRHVAIATHADLEVQDPRLLRPIHLQGDMIYQLNENLFKAHNARVNASELPYDPGLSITVNEATLENKQIVRHTIFGFPIVDRSTGQPVVDMQRYFRGRSVFLWLENVPVFYLPFLQGDAEDPLGPLQNVSIAYNRIFGAQIFTTWDMYDLIGITAIPGTRWRLNLDVMTERGPAIGTDFTFQGENLLGVPNRYIGLIKAYGMYDGGEDIIGGGRGQFIRGPGGTFFPVDHPDVRGRFRAMINVQDLPNGFTVQSQINALSDKNFLEQFYLNEFYNDPIQQTFLYVKQQEGNWAWTGLIQPRIRRWVTETEWYPKVDGYVLGASLFDVATYNLKASAGYGQLKTADEPPFAYFATDRDVNAGRFDLWQELSVPLALGPVKVVPYGIVDLTYYTNDLTGDDRGRFYGAGGVRTAMPMSRLYPDVNSELFNLDTIFHKIMLHGNFYTAYSDTSFRQLPQFDRLNDDASDQALRDLFFEQQFLNPANALALTTSPLFDPQVYALRRLVLNRIDTRDDIEVIQLGIDQRWQTKRGFPGRQHIVDWMTLNLSASLFPRADRDNFGTAAAFLEYDWTWNIGDRTSLVSNGWIDPIDGGPRLFNFGTYLNRPDFTSFYLGYRHIDPLQSRSVIGALTYEMSRKYALTASASYDFGVENQVTSLVLTRRGKDLRVSLGITYNSILNNVGVVFEVLPNIVPVGIRAPGIGGPFSSALAR